MSEDDDSIMVGLDEYERSMYRRVVRIETKISKLLEYVGLNPLDGNPPPKVRLRRSPVTRNRATSRDNT